MFVRFRQRGRRLNLSLIETRREDGTVRHEHIAALGSVVLPVDVRGRVDFWHQLHPRLDRLSNRIDSNSLQTVLGAIHVRIPMVTLDELRELKLDTAQSEVRAWDGLRDMQAATAVDHEALAAKAAKVAAAAKERAAEADKLAASAKERATRLEAGEDIAAGIKKLDVRQVLREAGVTEADMRHWSNLAELTGEDGVELHELVELMIEHHERYDRRLVRRLLRGLHRWRRLEEAGMDPREFVQSLG